MDNLMNLINTVMRPVGALMIYKNATTSDQRYYVESAKIGKGGALINHHPLTVAESQRLASHLASAGGRADFLSPKGILSPAVLLLRAGSQGFAIWHTPAQKAYLLFAQQTGIPSGNAWIPPLLWKATASSLTIFALDSNQRPTAQSVLYHSPFYNVTHCGSVCMGSVRVRAASADGLETFIQTWQEHFFNSYFTHVHRQLTGDSALPKLWKDLMATGNPFPVDTLKKSSFTLKSLYI